LMAVLSTVYPAMHLRYSITTVLAWAPLVAMVVEPLVRTRGGWLAMTTLRAASVLVFVVMLVYLWAAGLSLAFDASRFSASVADGRRALARACGMKLPVVFQVRHLMYPSTNGPPASPRRSACDTRYLAVSNATLERMFPAGSHLPRFYRFENEIARLHERLYGYPRVSTQSQLDAVPRFLVVGWDESFQDQRTVQAFGRAVFPNYRVTRITADLAVFERR
ncbi:MAG: hypothetical protein ACRENU_16250, partial [Gemmatimonadaceae bacterium]